MKRKMKHVFLFLLIFTVAFAPKEKDKIIRSKFAGKANRKDWSLSDVISFHNPQKSDNRVTVGTLWDMDSLYFIFNVTDSDLRAIQTEKDHLELFLDDMVEILLDTRNDKTGCWKEDDIVYHINLLGQKKDDRGNENCQTDPTWDGQAGYTVRISGALNDTTGVDEGFQVEIAFPWTELELQPVKGLRIGVNFANGDNDGNGRQLFDWAGANPMRSPDTFGTLILTE
jgi:hypothetical protein